MTRARGFSLLELLVAITIVGVVLAAAVPSSARFYESMQRRAAIRDVITLFASAREKALTSGVSQDVFVRPATRRLWLAEKDHVLPEGLTLMVHGAAELNLDDIGVIRFYADGSASGGGVDIQRPDGSGTRISVDWLVGSVRQQPLVSG